MSQLLFSSFPLPQFSFFLPSFSSFPLPSLPCALETGFSCTKSNYISSGMGTSSIDHWDSQGRWCLCMGWGGELTFPTTRASTWSQSIASPWYHVVMIWQTKSWAQHLQSLAGVQGQVTLSSDSDTDPALLDPPTLPSRAHAFGIVVCSGCF